MDENKETTNNNAICHPHYERSESLKELAAALIVVQGSMEPASKDATNPHYGSKYSTLASVWEAARKPISDNGLCLIQFPHSPDGRQVTIETVLLHKSGEWVSCYLTVIPERANAQGLGSAISYGRRYSMSAILGIVADDDDGNEASGLSGSSAAPRVGRRVPQENQMRPRTQDTKERTPGEYANEKDQFRAIWQRLKGDLHLPDDAKPKQYLEGWFGTDKISDFLPAQHIQALQALDKSAVQDTDRTRSMMKDHPGDLGKELRIKTEGE